jgi:3-methylcrotonyl-CoA carboxylase alpha subunit
MSKPPEFNVLHWDPPAFTLQSEGRTCRGYFYATGEWIDVHLPQGTYRIRLSSRGKTRASASHGAGGLTSPMPGKVIQLLVRPGQAVKQGDLLMILEAMKMEHKILSPRDGVVKKIYFVEGERVSQDVELIEIE